MKSKIVASLAFTAGFAFYLAPAADAATVQLIAYGTVGSVTQESTSGAAQPPFGIATGDSFEAIVELDSSASEAVGLGDPTFSRFDGAISSARIVVNGNDYALPVTAGAPKGNGGSAITVYNDAPLGPGLPYQDGLWFQTANVATTPDPPETLQFFSLFLTSLTTDPSSILTSDTLQYWQAGQFAGTGASSINFGIANSIGGFSAVVTVDSVSVAAVPLPAGAWLLLSGVVGLFSQRVRSKAF